MLVTLGRPRAAIAGDADALADDLRSALQPAVRPDLEPGQLLISAIVDAARELPSLDPGSVAISVASGPYARRVLAKYVEYLEESGYESLSREHTTSLEPSLLNEEAGKATGLSGPALTLVGGAEAGASGLFWAIDALAGGELASVLAAELSEIGQPPVPLAVCVPLLAGPGAGRRLVSWRARSGLDVGRGRPASSTLCQLAIAAGRPEPELIIASVGALDVEFVLGSLDG